MARQINYEKLEAIRQSTMELIAQNGSQKTSISMIAKHAGVSAGYLYTHFDSKDDLINDLIHDLYLGILDMLRRIGESGDSVQAMMESFLLALMNLSSEEPMKAKFLISLAHDERFIKEFLLDDPHGVFKIATKILERGKLEAVFRQDLIVEELLLMILNLPISSMFYGCVVEDSDKFENEMKKRIVNLCLTALR